jgi:hypothetical protein
MYTHERDDLTTWQNIKAFWWRTLSRVYPMHLLWWATFLPYIVSQWIPGHNEGCWVRPLCHILQLGMLDSWAGCGWRFIVNGPAWFLSSIAWFWMAFPLGKDAMVRFLDGRKIWHWMVGCSIAWSCLSLALSPFDIYTVSGFPPLRAGEFIIGCGTALALKQPTPRILSGPWPAVWTLVTIAFYWFQSSRHPLDFLCIHERPEHKQCALWLTQHEYMLMHPPCMTWFDKVVNRSALVWAGLIHAVSRLELAARPDDTGWLMRIVNAEIFQFLSTFSLSLYLSHISIGGALRWIWLKIGQDYCNLHDDTVLALIYFICYCIHHLVKLLVIRWFGPSEPLPRNEEVCVLLKNDTVTPCGLQDTREEQEAEGETSCA